MDTDTERRGAIETPEALPPAPRQPRPLVDRRGPRRPPTWAAVVIAAAVLIGLVGTLFSLSLRPGVDYISPALRATATSSIVPSYFTYNDAAASPYLNSLPEVFSATIQLTPCVYDPGATAGQGAPPQSYTTTWLYQQPTYAVVYVRATCHNQTHPGLLLTFFQDAMRTWHMQVGLPVNEPNPNAHHPNPAPSWAPADNYDQSGVDMASGANFTPSLHMIYWISQTHAYVLGYVTNFAGYPSGQVPVTIGGRSGWVTQEGGMATVVLPEPHGAAFFSGTGTPVEVMRMAQAASGELNALMEPVTTP